MRSQRGQATVELVLLLPLVMLLLFTVLQVGVVARDQVLVAHAAREAARSIAIDGDAPRARSAARRVVDDATVDVTSEDGFVRVDVRRPVHLLLPLFGRWFDGMQVHEFAVARIEQ